MAAGNFWKRIESMPNDFSSQCWNARAVISQICKGSDHKFDFKMK
jgi:hypothetical protein